MKTKNPNHQTTRDQRLEAKWPWLLPLFESKNVSRRQTLNAGTTFIIRDTAQCMKEHTGKQFIQLRSRAEIHTQRECGHRGAQESDTRRRHTLERSVGVLSEEDRGTEGRKSLIQESPSPSLFPFGPLSCFLLHTAGPWTLPKMRVQLFAKMDPTAEAYECMSTFIMGWGPLPFQPPRSLLRLCRQGSLP